MNSSLLLNIQNQKIVLANQEKKIIDLNLHLARGELLLIQGANGAGKSTVMKWLAKTYAKKSVYLAQGADCNLLVPAQLLDLANIYASFTNKSLDAELQELFPQHLWSLSWNSASLGERQRALLAGLFHHSAKELYFLDEPTSALDLEAEKIFWSLIQKKISEEKKSFVIVYHGNSQDIPEHRMMSLL